MPLVMAVRNRILSVEIVSSLQLALFQWQLMDGTFHACLLIVIVYKPLSKCQMNLITLQKLCTRESFPSPWPSAKFSQVGMFASSTPEAKFFSWHDCHIVLIVGINWNTVLLFKHLACSQYSLTLLKRKVERNGMKLYYIRALSVQ